jgi:NAD+ kinase
VKRVGFIIKPDKIASGKVLPELARWVRELGHVPVIPAEERSFIDGAVIVPRDQIGKEIDLAVVLGGDGTMLAAAALVADERVPVLGINLGRLGFLTPFDLDQAEEAVAAAVSGKLTTSERMRLAVTYTPDGEAPVTRMGLNDAVIHQGSMARLIEVEVRLDGELVSYYRADGLIVATPTGSTAYNLAAGGPIIEPGQRAMVLTPICPHSLTNRSLVVPGSSSVTLTLNNDSMGVVLTIDGQWAHSFLPSDHIEIAAAETPLVLFNSDKRYFDILREKLHWGARSDRSPEQVAAVANGPRNGPRNGHGHTGEDLGDDSGDDSGPRGADPADD